MDVTCFQCGEVVGDNDGSTLAFDGPVEIIVVGINQFKNTACIRAFCNDCHNGNIVNSLQTEQYNTWDIAPKDTNEKILDYQFDKLLEESKL